MRRALANLLIAFWIAAFCAPLLGAPALPACCRAGGRHHCMQPSSGDGFQPQAACCPYRNLSALASQAGNALPASAQSLDAISSQGVLALAQFSPVCRRPVDNVPDRGPPSI
jgi:hypothetical protein